MNDSFSTTKVLTINTVFGKDALLINSMQGTESVSELFDFELVLHSENHDLLFDEIIGTNACVNIRSRNGSVRHINGIISSFQHDGAFALEDAKESPYYSQYRAKLVPWFWSLQLNNDCRIFQEKSVPAIISEVLTQHNIAKFQFRLTKNYDAREYCVQYRESDFNFVSRLLEEEGIYYFFEHSEKEHLLVLIDDSSQINVNQLQTQVKFGTLFGDESSNTFIKDLKIKQELRPDSVQLRDFNFKSPSVNLTSDLKGKKSKGFEIYDYPGEFDKHSEGEKLARIRYEEQQCQKELMVATSNGRGFEAGFRFKLEEHPRKDFNRDYTILKVEHEASQDTFRTNTGTPFYYWSNLTCIPYKTPFRPHRKTNIPKIVGTQTAFVVGPKGEEIHVDKHGRIKVHFHWDRVEKNSKSSCWIRVSQPWAGTGFGGITIPRIGQEVIVDFLEGNPDNPIITGRVYNGEAKPPYELPANKAHSGLMSRSTPGGGSANFNGIRFNDESGAEKMEVQAEKDQQILVKNDKAEDVLNDETVNIGNNRTEQVFGNEVRTIAKDLLRTVLQNQTEVVALNRSKNIGLDDAKTVGLSQSVEVGVDRSISVGINETKQVGVDRSIIVGNDEVKQIGGNKLKSIEGSNVTKITKNDQKRVKGKKVTKTDGQVFYESKTGILLKVGDSILSLTPNSITLKIGGSSIEMNKSHITVAAGETNVLGSKVQVVAMNKVVINGNLVEIN